MGGGTEPGPAPPDADAPSGPTQSTLPWAREPARRERERELRGCSPERLPCTSREGMGPSSPAWVSRSPLRGKGDDPAASSFSSSEEDAGDSDSDFMPPGRRAGVRRLNTLDAAQRCRLVHHATKCAVVATDSSQMQIARTFQGNLEAEGVQVTLAAVRRALREDMVPTFISNTQYLLPKQGLRKMDLLQEAESDLRDRVLREEAFDVGTCNLFCVLRAATDTGVLGAGKIYTSERPLQSLSSVAYLGWRARTNFRIGTFEPPSHVELIARFYSWGAALDAAWELFLSVVAAAEQKEAAAAEREAAVEKERIQKVCTEAQAEREALMKHMNIWPKFDETHVLPN